MYIFYHPLGTARLGAAFIFLIGLSTVRSVNFSTCGDDGFREVIIDQMTNFTCGAEGLMEWRLILSSSPNSFNIATCEKGKCEISGILGQTFTASVIAPQQTLLVINASASNRDIYDFIDILNGSLQCAYVADQKIVERARCHLSYVAPPEKVSCSGLNTSGTIRVSCVTGTVFSSRKIYKCHLFRFKNDSQKESLGIVNMMTSPTTERIAENEVKVSGSCQFNTTQPPDEGSFRYFVTLTPSGLNYSVKFNEGFMTNAPTRPLFSINGRVNHDTVKEGDKVHFQCNSIGQPVPQVHIYNQDNGTLIRTDSSFINYSLIADCTDTAIYMCSAWNSFSNQPNVTTSVSLDVKCKPRKSVSTHFKGEKWSCEFEVIANPAPYQYRLWRPKENSSDASYEELETSIINVKCESDTRRRYLSRCSLTVSNITFQSVTDLYKVQIINEVGEENFTLEACYTQEIGMTLQCPPLFHDGENVVICKINKTAIEEANCKLKYNSVIFEWIDNAGETAACRTVYNTKEKCTSDDNHKPDSCWCAETSGEIFTYKFSFLANSTRDKGRQLTCRLCGKPLNYLNIISDGCENMTFDDHEDSKTDKSKLTNSDVGLIVGAVLGALAILMIMIMVIWIKKRQSFPYFCKTKKDARETSAVQNGHELKELMPSTCEEGKQNADENRCPFKC